MTAPRRTAIRTGWIIAFDGRGHRLLPPGAKADLVLWKATSWRMTPLGDPVKNIVYNATSEDVDRVWVDAQAFESDVALLRVGQAATVRGPTLPERGIDARKAGKSPKSGLKVGRLKPDGGGIAVGCATCTCFGNALYSSGVMTFRSGANRFRSASTLGSASIAIGCPI